MADLCTPSVVAMLVCDQIIAEQGTGKKSLVGVFDNMYSPGFPVQTRFAVYAKLVDLDQGQYKCRVRLVKLKDETLVADLTADLVINDPLSPAELAINMVGIIVPEAGKYEFQLYADDIYLHRITLNAVQGGFPWQPLPQRPS